MVGKVPVGELIREMYELTRRRRDDGERIEEIIEELKPFTLTLRAYESKRFLVPGTHAVIQFYHGGTGRLVFEDTEAMPSLDSLDWPASCEPRDTIEESVEASLELPANTVAS